ncbi:uncharacterized protein [Centruroides vittatus]|uniref:uncharacterized protein n=1 Tax=Centruroides vittatus TaxID=120091 RepID=UPI00350EF7A9
MLRTLMAFICIFPECHPKWVSYYKEDFHSNLTDGKDELLNVRSKRSVEWFPEYQMYEEWAKEYYQSHATPIVVVPDKSDSKKDILEKFFELQRNATTMDRFRQSNFFNYTLTGMAVIAGVFFVCYLLQKIVNLVTRKGFRQDRNSRIFLEEAERFLNVYQSGLRVEDGKRRYEPSHEEEEAYLHAKRMVNKLKIELI